MTGKRKAMNGNHPGDHNHDPSDHSGHGHGHSHVHGLGGDASASGLRTAFFLNLGFTLFEIAGGLFTNSIAVLSDAVHDAGDSLSLGLAWYLQRLSKKKPNRFFTYGYQRFSTLGAFITGTVLLVGLCLVLYHAIPRLLDPQPVHAPGVMALALVGIVINGLAVLRTRRGTSLNEAVVSWHLLEDVLGWVAVLIGGLIMTLWDAPIVDPLLSIGISVFILFNVVKSLRAVGRVFLQSAPESFDVDEFRGKAGNLPGVRDIHHTHSWSIDGEQHVFSTHVVMQGGSSREDILRVKQQLRDLLAPHDFRHLTVEVELEGEECLMPGEEDRHNGLEQGNH